MRNNYHNQIPKVSYCEKYADQIKPVFLIFDIELSHKLFYIVSTVAIDGLNQLKDPRSQPFTLYGSPKHYDGLRGGGKVSFYWC